MEIEKAMSERRSIRRFKKGEVPPAKIRKIIEAATLAPSASNRQHWEFVVISDDKTKKELVEKAGAQKLILNAPQIIAALYDKRFNQYHNANIQTVSAAVQNMMLKAHEIGLGTCWICGFGEEDKVKEILHVPEHLGVLCLVMLGVPDEKPFPPRKRPLEELMHDGKYAQKKGELPKTIRTSGWTVDQIMENQKLASRSNHLGKDYEIYSEIEVKKISKTIENHLPKKGSLILNVLGYDGTLLKMMMPVLNGYRVADFEFSEAAKDFVEYKVKGIKYFTGKNIGMEDGKADMALMMFSLEKTPDPGELLKETRRVLKPGAKLLIFIKNKKSFYGLVYNGIEKILGVRDIESFYIRSGPFEPVSVSDIRQALEKDFDIKSNGIFFLPPEIDEFFRRAQGYKRRHKMKKGFLMKPIMLLSMLGFRTTKWFRPSSISSTVVIVAKKR